MLSRNRQRARARYLKGGAAIPALPQMGPWLTTLGLETRLVGSSSFALSGYGGPPESIQTVVRDYVVASGTANSTLVTTESVVGDNSADVATRIAANSAWWDDSAVVLMFTNVAAGETGDQICTANLLPSLALFTNPGLAISWINLHRNLDLRGVDEWPVRNEARRFLDAANIPYVSVMGVMRYGQHWQAQYPALPGVPSDFDQIKDTDRFVFPGFWMFDGAHGGPNLRAYTGLIMSGHLVEAWQNGLPMIASGQRVFSRETTNLTNGGFVGNIPFFGGRNNNKTPVPAPLAGCTVSLATADSDFAVSISGNNIQLTRTSSGLILDGRRVLYVRIAKTGFGQRDYPVEVHLCRSAGAVTPRWKNVSADVPDALADSADRRWGPWLIIRQNNRPDFATLPRRGWSMVMRTQRSVDPAQTLFMDGASSSAWGIRLQYTTSGRIQFSVRDSTNTTIDGVFNSATNSFLPGADFWLFASIDSETGGQLQIARDDLTATTRAYTTVPFDIGIGPNISIFTGATSSFQPNRGRIMELWQSHQFIDWTVAANRDAFRNSTTQDPVLVSESGTALGITPAIWIPPWATAGDWFSGQNWGTGGPFLPVDGASSRVTNV